MNDARRRPPSRPPELCFGFRSYTEFLATMKGRGGPLRLATPAELQREPPLWPADDDEAASMGFEISHDDSDR